MKAYITKKISITTKIDKKLVVYILLLIPFFQLYSIDLLMNKGVLYPLLYLIDRVLAVARWGITGYLLIDTILKKRNIGNITKFVIVFSIMRCLSIIINGDFGIGVIVGNVTYIGFSLLIERLLACKSHVFINSNIILFGLLSYVSVLTNLLIPYGFFYSSTKAGAIYFLGSKNSGFSYYILFLFFFIICSLLKRNKMPSGTLINVTFLAIGAYIASSANTLICMLIMFWYVLFVHIIENNVKIFEPKKICLFVVVIAYLILFGKDISFINGFLELFGRNITFSGRDYIWQMNLEEYMLQPLWGVGYTFEIILMNGSPANHAHNFFLDNLVKYGIFEFIVLICIIVQVIRSIAYKSNKKIIVFYSVILFIVLLHCLFEDIMIYELVLLFVSMEKLGETKRN